MHLFYLPDLQCDETTALFPEEESAHAVRVLRLNVGDEVLITNGKGWMFTATISEAHPKHTQAQIVTKRHSTAQRRISSPHSRSADQKHRPLRVVFGKNLRDWRGRNNAAIMRTFRTTKTEHGAPESRFNRRHETVADGGVAAVASALRHTNAGVAMRNATKICRLVQ